MGESGLILGVSGLRGVVGESLTPEVAARYAAVVGTWLCENVEARPLVLIARDGRAGGDAIYMAAISGLLASGCRVCRLGIAMTPTAGVVTDAKRAHACVIVTASHNPQEWNGLKLIVSPGRWGGDTDGRGEVITAQSDARAPHATMAQEIVDRFISEQIEWEDAEYVDDSGVEDDVEDPHCLRVLEMCERVFDESNFWDMFDAHPLRVVVDSVNASGTTACAYFYDGTPCKLFQLNGEMSGVFPHTPEPTKENLSGEGGLCDAVPGLKADVGFAQDPDADRLAIVDEGGRYIGEEYTLVLAAVALLEAGNERRQDAGATKTPVIVTNLSTSRMIDDVAARYGARVERAAVGEANVVERMMALRAQGEDVILGGEGNGGVIWPDVVYVRDSLSAMALTLALMARTGKTVSQLVSWIDSMAGEGTGGGGYAIVKRKVGIPSKDAATPAVEKVIAAYSGAEGVEIDTQDGVRVDWPGRRAWVHVRASNTEPIMRLIAEAPTGEEAERILGEVEGVIGAG